jgi:hypothetical protein
MLGRRSHRLRMFEVDTMVADFVGRQNFCGFRASRGGCARLQLHLSRVVKHANRGGLLHPPPSLAALLTTLIVTGRLQRATAVKKAHVPGRRLEHIACS